MSVELIVLQNVKRVVRGIVKSVSNRQWLMRSQLRYIVAKPRLPFCLKGAGIRVTRAARDDTEYPNLGYAPKLWCWRLRYPVVEALRCALGICNCER